MVAGAYRVGHHSGRTSLFIFSVYCKYEAVVYKPIDFSLGGGLHSLNAL